MSDDLSKKLLLQETALQQMLRDLHPFKSIVAEQERLAQIANPLRAIVEEVERSLRPFDQALIATGLMDQIALASKSNFDIAAFENPFQNPAVEALAAFQESIAHTNIVQAISRYSMETESVSRAVAAMQFPMIDVQKQLFSIAALTELQGIGYVLATMPSFSNNVACALRVDLGDWRIPLAVDYTALLDPVVRSDFYVARGFDPNLTAFQTSDFREGLTSAGLYDPEAKADSEHLEDDTETAFMLTNEAHNRLMRFEYFLRRAIDNAMSIAVGPDWIKHRVSGEMRQNWTRKKEQGLVAGEAEQPLLAYADFTDYVQIIVRNDNWRDVFVAIFQHKQSVEESFRRLFPVRVCTMHARPITQDDALFLLVEIKRLSKAMGFEL